VGTSVLTPPPPLAPTIGWDNAVTGLDPTMVAGPDERRTPGTRAKGGPLLPGEAFGPRYHIIRLLGAGGMGAVYHAWDAELGVAVAVKVIRPEVMADPAVANEVAQRFKRELLLARAVTHKNVVRIHDLGEIEGIKYITMSYVEGWDLATILVREGRLDIPRALRIARAIVSGLRAAHEAGVVHRDLKPENVMVDNADGEALIMDFGIARSTTRPDITPQNVPDSVRHLSPTPNQNQTVAGSVVGTVNYMAPEQARGQAVDQRADIYAFGLILYEMLVGRDRGKEKRDPLTDMTERFMAPPPPARTLNDAVPQPLDAIVTRCLQPDAAARYQTTADLMAAFDRLDEKGELLPITARVTRRQLALAAMLVVTLLAGTWGLTRWFTPVPVEAPPPMSVLIADFENATNDPVFDGTLENALNLAMEGASFINAYPRQDAMAVANQVGSGITRLDATTARLVSQRELIKVVLAGRIEPDGSGYRIGLRVIDPIPGTTLSEATARAGSKADVLQALGTAAAEIRESLGDATSETEKLTADESFTAASLDASREYAMAQTLASSGKDEEAIGHYQRAIQHDPRLGRAYSGWALSADRLGRKDESLEQWKQALALLDRMSERERYRTQATYFSRVMRNYEKAAENNTQLVQKYPADGIAHNNLAVAHFNLLTFTKALDEGKVAAELYPATALYRYNYALYAMYAGDFVTAEREAKVAIKTNPATFKAYLALAMSALSRGDAKGAEAAYLDARDNGGVRGASLASIGVADLAMYQGRYADAEGFLIKGIGADEESKNTAGAALKYVALAEAHLAQRETAAALIATQRALKLSRSPAVMVPAARVLMAAGKEFEARALATELESQLQPVNRAYGKVIAGEIALHRGVIPDAVDAFLAAQQMVDYTARGGNKGYWLSRYGLGVAYVRAGHYAEALSEFDACVKRQGEVAAVFLDDVPTYRYAVPLPYWTARAQEGVQGKAAARPNYEKFLALRGGSSSDPLVADAKARLATP
jgi:tetratricopeptide (TPR) repeat protein/tRNA A-37 threonylcarbamoyl transferase component Bud32